MIDASHPFQPGVKVAIVSRGRWENSVSFKEAVVAKVHKTGHFFLAGSDARFSPILSSGGWIARTTASNWYGGQIEMLTDALREEAAASARRSEFAKTIDAFERFRGEVSEIQLAALRALREEMLK